MQRRLCSATRSNLNSTGLAAEGARRDDPPIAVAARTWFNEDLESLANIVPGVVAIVMAVVGTFLTSLTIAREWERGTMEQLISTPVTPLELMIGQTLALSRHRTRGYGDLRGDGQSGGSGCRFAAAWHVLFVSSTLFLVVVLSLGYFLSVLASRNSPRASFDDGDISPAFLLSGFYLSDRPDAAFIQLVTHDYSGALLHVASFAHVPEGHAVRAAMGGHAGAVIFATVLVLVATRAFQKRLR